MKVYAVRDKHSGKLVNDITNPKHKFWEKEKCCMDAINRYNEHLYKSYDLEMVTFELVEVTEND